jgi:hypothetical protein
MAPKRQLDDVTPVEIAGEGRTWELGSRNRHSHRAIPTKIHRPHRNTTHGHLRRARTQAAAGSPATPLRHGNGGKCFILAPPGTPDGPGQVV